MKVTVLYGSFVGVGINHSAASMTSGIPMSSGIW